MAIGLQAAWSLALCKTGGTKGARGQADESGLGAGRGVTFRQGQLLHRDDDADARHEHALAAQGDKQRNQDLEQNQAQPHAPAQQQQPQDTLSFDLAPPVAPLVVPDSVAASHWSASCGMTCGAWFDTVVGQKLHVLWHEQQHSMQQHERKTMHKLEQMHAQVLQELARLKDYDPRSVTALVQRYTESVRQLAVQSEQQQRQQGAAFMEHLASTASSTFATTLEASLEERDKLHRIKVAALSSEHEQRMAAMRTSAAMERSAAVDLQAKRHRQQHDEQVQGLTAEWAARAAHAEKESERLRALWSNAQREGELLRDEALTNKKEALEWRGKWERDGGRNGMLQREHEQAQRVLEEQIAQLHAHQRLELQQRDNVLRRCKDTIIGLEAQLLEARRRIEEQGQ